MSEITPEQVLSSEPVATGIDRSRKEATLENVFLNSAVDAYKIEKYEKCKKAFEVLSEAEDIWVDAFERPLLLKIDMTPEIKEAMTWLLEEALPEIYIDYKSCGQIKKVQGWKDWTSFDYDTLMLMRFIFQSVMGKGVDFALKLSKSILAFEQPFKIVYELDREKTRVSQQYKEAESRMAKVLSEHPLDKPKQKEDFMKWQAAKIKEMEEAKNKEILEAKA